MNAALVLTALFNGAWQGALLCTLAAFVFRFWRRLNATTMFTVWSVLLAIAVALPFANYAFAPRPVVVKAPMVVQSGVVVQTHTRAIARRLHYGRGPSIPQDDKAGVSIPQRDTVLSAFKTVLHYAMWVLLLLAAIAFVRLALLGRDVVRMLVARTRVRPIEAPVSLSSEIARPFRFAASDEFTSPCVLGFTPALIVIPEELLADRGSELTSVVLHEREHVRRFDDIQNVIQRFIGAIAFFCPGVRIALRELALYREQICDDAAVNATGDRVSYAMTLTDLAQWAQGRGAPVPSLIFKRKHLLHRLEVLLDSAVNHSLRMNRRFAFSAAVALVIAALAVLRVQVPVVAETLSSPAPAVVKSMHQRAAAIRQNLVQLRRNTAVMRHNAETMHRNVVVMHKQLVELRHDAKALRAVVRPRYLVRPSIPQDDKPWRPHDDRARRAPRVAIASVQVAAVGITAVAPAAPMIVPAGHDEATRMLDALNNAGLRNLPVDQLIALRDHGVSPQLVQDAASYFGHVGASDLTTLADHGVGAQYIATLRQGGISGITPDDAIKMMDHGVSAPLIRAALDYFTVVRPGPNALVFMADHGLSATYIESLRSSGLKACWEDAVQMMNHGVDGLYVRKILRSNPHATIRDIIRLRDAGF